MDVVATVQGHISDWQSGQALCRELVLPAHSDPFEPASIDRLSTVYSTLISSTLVSFSANAPFPSDQFLPFVRSIVFELPSSSSGPSPNAVSLGELLIDTIWSLDMLLDETVNEGKAALAAAGGDEASTATKTKTITENVEKDKKTISTILKQLLNAGIVDPSACRTRLDSGLLASVGLIGDKIGLDRREVRIRTGIFYKQNKFNLLREQSEGYSKVTVELTSALGPGHSAATGRPDEPPKSIAQRAHPVWEKLLSIIGYFDLDPNRALDLILDVFSVHISTHWTFFLALLSFSPWAARLQPTKTLQDTVAMDVDSKESPYNGKTFDEVLSSVDPLPSISPNERPEAPVIAQVLGFKFTYHDGPEAPETPRNLYLLAALLIREGFMTLEDLYPHLTPSDDGMQSVYDQYRENLKNKSSGNTSNKLASSMLSLDAMIAGQSTQSSSKDKTPEVSKDTETKNASSQQKIGLLEALLSIGALKQGLTLLSKFPWIVDARPEVSDLLIRIMRHSIEPLFKVHIQKDREYPISGFAQPRAQLNAIGKPVVPVRKPALSLFAPTPPPTKTTDFVFFFPDWVERVPVCRTSDDLRNVIEPLLGFVGVQLSRNPSFMHMYIRLARDQLSKVKDDKEQEDDEGRMVLHPTWAYWFKMIRTYLLPALPLLNGNAMVTVEVWSILRQYDISARWAVYAEWAQSYKSHPELEVRSTEVLKETKDILRRLALDSVDSLSGPIAKLAHTNPCIFFPRAVFTVMSYDNMQAALVLSLRYCASMDFDVLTFWILDALTNKSRERVKDDGINISDWLQNLSTFIGSLFKRYSADITPLLNYVVHQLVQDNTTEIIVLKELIYTMAGIEPLPSLSDSQIQAMAGGPTLRVEAVASTTRGAKFDPTEIGNRPAHRLGKALVDSQLALPLLVQVAQKRQSCVYKAPNNAPVKPLSSLFDTTHGVLLQYQELLTTESVISLEQYATKILPSLGEMAESFGIAAPICMQIFRPVLQASILKKAIEEGATEEREQALKAKLIAAKQGSRVATPTTNSQPETPSDAKQDAPASNGNAMDVEASPAAEQGPWLPELAGLFDDVAKMIPSAAYTLLGPGFYTTFWQMSTYDLNPPLSKYDEETRALRALSQAEDQKYAAAERSSDRRRRQTATAHRLRRDRFNKFSDALLKEGKDQVTNRSFTVKRLAKEKMHWFSHPNCQSSSMIDSFIEHCIQPRCLLSPMDADYCAQIIRTIHSIGTPNFHTLRCYDKLLKLLDEKIAVVLASCTEYEAKNYGRFLHGLLAEMDKWRSNEQTYLNENRSRGALAPGQKDHYHPGFRISLNGQFLSWKEFHALLKKWHSKLVQAFIPCIKSRKHMHVYNTIIVLKEILPVFPLRDAHPWSGLALHEELQKFIAEEQRNDLKVIARAYISGLEKRKAYWEPKSAASATTTKSAGPPTQPKAGTPKPALSHSGSNVGEKRRDVPPPGPGTPVAPAAQRPPSHAPSAPRADTKSFAANVAKPPVVKRVRQENTHSPSPRPSTPKAHDSDPTKAQHEPPKGPNAQSTERDIPGPLSATDQPKMPPPSNPSQTPSANELRDLRDTVRQGRSDRDEDKGARSRNGSRASSPRRDSPSPSRPGTRNHSSDSRASGGRRSDRRDDERDRRAPDARNGSDGREPARRDSLTHDRRERRSRRDDKDDDRDRAGRRDRDERDSRADRDRDGGRNKDKGHRIGREEKESRNDRDLHREPPSRSSRGDDSGRGREEGHKRSRDTDDDSQRPSKRGSGGRRETRDRDPRDPPGRADRSSRKRDHDDADDRGDSRHEKGDRRGDGPSSRAPPTGPRTRAPDSPPQSAPSKPRDRPRGDDTYIPGDANGHGTPRGSEESGPRSLQSRLGAFQEDERDNSRKRSAPDPAQRNEDPKRARVSLNRNRYDEIQKHMDTPSRPSRGGRRGPGGR